MFKKKVRNLGLIIGLIAMLGTAFSVPAMAEIGQRKIETAEVDQLVPNKIDGHLVPKKVGDYPVIYVQQFENAPWLDSGEVILILRGDQEIETVLNNSSVIEAAKTLPHNWRIKVVGGRNFTISGMLESIDLGIVEYEKAGPLPKSGPMPIGDAYLSSLHTAGKDLRSYDTRTYAYCVNKDPDTKTIIFQSANWYAPTVGSQQDEYSLMTLVGETNYDFNGKPEFIQIGQWYRNSGIGRLAWTSTYQGYYPQWFDMQYQPGNKYYHFMSKSIGSNYWYVGVQNLTSGGYETELITALGNRLISDYSNNDFNTGVFFENFNSNSNWHNGFTNPIRASYALDKEQGHGYTYWSDELQIIQEVDNINNYWYYDDQLSDDVIDGHLDNGGTAEWELDDVWLAP
ncbi:MAG: hypothetical protein R6U89_00765 [Dehalococcoidia bacterium]